ncbi:MAG TPA: hypothetical protein PKB06_09610 [Actinotalea sp.]|nr:hypothetical protein [Actinotalea sp.]
MGWWKVEGTPHTIGDHPLDALGSAVTAVVAEYREHLGRAPTLAEWECLLRAVLGAEEEEYRPSDDAVVVDVKVLGKEA